MIPDHRDGMRAAACYTGRMSNTALRHMTAEAFLAWDLDQPDARHELVDGAPVAMTGARRRHDRIVVNALADLRTRLRAGPCVPFTADTAVRIPNGNVRRPDLGVVCGADDDDLTYAAAPRLVVEVLSPATRLLDRAGKLDDYKAVPGLDYILLVDPDAPRATLWSRDSRGGWSDALIAGLKATIDLPALGVAVPMAELYAGLAFRPG